MKRKAKIKILSGRSMIEMLGVLAIIGILSAGGVMGYSAAMEAYKVNKTIQLITQGTAQTMTVFREKAKGLGSNVTYADALCSLMILPDEICQTCNEEEICKGYFGEDIIPRVWVDDYDRMVLSDVVTDAGVITIANPSEFAIIFTSAIPVSACTKLVSSQAWSNVDKIAVLYDESSNKYEELPFTIAKAIERCNEVMQGGKTFQIDWWFASGAITAE